MSELEAEQQNGHSHLLFFSTTNTDTWSSAFMYIVILDNIYSFTTLSVKLKQNVTFVLWSKVSSVSKAELVLRK